MRAMLSWLDRWWTRSGSWIAAPLILVLAMAGKVFQWPWLHAAAVAVFMVATAVTLVYVARIVRLLHVRRGTRR